MSSLVRTESIVEDVSVQQGLGIRVHYLQSLILLGELCFSLTSGRTWSVKSLMETIPQGARHVWRNTL